MLVTAIFGERVELCRRFLEFFPLFISQSQEGEYLMFNEADGHLIAEFLLVLIQI